MYIRSRDYRQQLLSCRLSYPYFFFISTLCILPIDLSINRYTFCYHNNVMRYISALILFIFLLLSSSFNIYLAKDKIGAMTVAEVVDGDTFQLFSGKRVRLMGVDAPEYDRCGGKEARSLLTRLILNKQVLIEEEVQETFGRSLALVYTTKYYFIKDQLVNKIIMEEGWARPDYRKNSQREVLTSAFHEAKNNNLGLWGPLCRETSVTQSPLPAEASAKVGQSSPCLIKGNIDKATYKKYYHLPGCKQYNQIIMEKDIGEQYFCTEDEATRAGFLKSAGCP